MSIFKATESPEELYNFLVFTSNYNKQYGLFNVDGWIKRVCIKSSKFQELLDQEEYDFIGVYSKASVSPAKDNGDNVRSKAEFIEELYFALGKKIPA